MAVIRKPKSVRLAFRATEQDFSMLNALVEKTGMASSDVIRQAIRGYYTREVAETQGTLYVRDVRQAPSKKRTPKG